MPCPLVAEIAELGSALETLSTSISRSGNNSFSNADTALLMAPIELPRAGRYEVSSSRYEAADGTYWTAGMQRTFTNPYAAATEKSYVYSAFSQFQFGPGSGFSVRCLAR